MTFTIVATKRTPRKPEEDRARGFIPCVTYGPDIAPLSLSVPYGVFEKMYDAAGQSSLIDLAIEGQAPIKVLVQDVQYDPVTEDITHVDFRQINMKKPMSATVSLVFNGEAAAVKELGGTLVRAQDSVRVTCLPQNLIPHIDVDIASLKTFTDIIRVSDLRFPEGITITDDPHMTIARVLAPFTEEQLKAMEEAGPKGIEDIEVAKKEKKEGEEEAAQEESKPKEEKKTDKKE